MVITLQQFKEMLPQERKKIKKEEMMEILLNCEVPEMSDLTLAIKQLTGLVDGYREEQKEHSQLIVQLKTDVELLKNECSILKRDLALRINNLEQRTRICNIEIVGLAKPTLMETDTSVVINFLNNQAEVDLQEDEIEALHEVPSRRKDGKRLVIVHFKSRSRRDDILSVCKEKIRQYNKDKAVANRVFINEHLSPENKKLFALATKKKYELDYKFVWSKNETVLVRKDSNSVVHKINSVEDLDNLV